MREKILTTVYKLNLRPEALTFELLFNDLHQNKPVDQHVVNMIGKPTLKNKFDMFLVWFEQQHKPLLKTDQKFRNRVVYKIIWPDFKSEFEQLFNRFEHVITSDSFTENSIIQCYYKINKSWE